MLGLLVMRRVQNATPANVAVRRIAARTPALLGGGRNPGARTGPGSVGARLPDNTEVLAARPSRFSMDPRKHPDAAVGLRLVFKATALKHGQTMFSGNFVDRSGRVRRFGDVPLDDIAEYAAAAPGRTRSGDVLARVLMTVVSPGLLEAARVVWKMLGLWGGFSRAQRQT